MSGENDALRPGDKVMLLSLGNCSCAECKKFRSVISPGAVGDVLHSCWLCSVIQNKPVYHVQFSQGEFAAARHILKKLGDDPDAGVDLVDDEVKLKRDSPVTA